VNSEVRNNFHCPKKHDILNAMAKTVNHRRIIPPAGEKPQNSKRTGKSDNDPFMEVVL
jgi:hypothetical protein